MPTATFESLTEGEITIDFRPPRQSEVLACMAASAGVQTAADAQAVHLDFLAPLCDRDRSWLDDQVPFDVLAQIAAHLLASRLPGEDVLEKSRVSLA